MIVTAAALLLAACHGGGESAVPDDPADTRPFADIAPGEVIRFTGTEPFWGGQVAGTALTYATPENAAGTTITVERFAGRGGLAFSGELEGQPFDLAITPGACSDGMSERSYPFVATLQLGGEQRSGCAWRADDGLDSGDPAPPH